MIAAELAPESLVDSVAVPPTIAVTIAIERDAAEWDRFVEARRGASGYHLWAWRGVFSKAFGHESVYLVARNGERIAGVLPLVFINSRLFGRSLTSLPFLNYGGVVAESAEAADALLARAAEVARERRCGHVELRHVARQFPQLPCKQHKVTMRLQIEPGMWERLDRKVRNQIRKAQKSGLTSEVGGAGLLDEFYRVFARNMRDLGTPVYGRSLFREVLRAFPDRTRIHVVRLNGVPVAAGLTLHEWYDNRSALGFIGTRLQQPVSQPSAVLECDRSGDRERLRRARFRTLDATRGHLQIQGAVGRRARRAALGVPVARRNRNAECEPDECEVPVGDRALEETPSCCRNAGRTVYCAGDSMKQMAADAPSRAASNVVT